MDKAFGEIADRLRNAKSLLIVSHGRPDGDALGSMAALADSARAAGKDTSMFVPDSQPPKYDFLFDKPPCTDQAQFAALADQSDLIVIVDTCAFAQLDGLADELRARRDAIVVVDHHATADDIGAVRWMDTSAAAAGVMVDELLEELGWPVGPEAAEALMTAIATDTGWMRFANTDGRCLRAAARLVDAGVRTDKLYRKLYQTERPERIKLMRYALGTLELHCDQRLAAMTVRKSDIEAAGARPDETENLVNEALRLATVETAILLVESDEHVRVSLRSRDAVDVAAVAKRFGGGGHRRAAGVRVSEDIDTLKDKLLAACRDELARA